MGSLNASGVTVVPKQNISIRRYGRYTVIGSGTNPYGANNTELAAITEPPVHLLPGFSVRGSQSGIIDGDFYSTVQIAPAVKVYDSRSDVLISRNASGIAPDSGNQPEINLKPVSQNFSFHNSARIVTSNSDQDTVSSRAIATGVRPS